MWRVLAQLCMAPGRQVPYIDVRALSPDALCLCRLLQIKCSHGLLGPSRLKHYAAVSVAGLRASRLEQLLLSSCWAFVL